MSIELREQYNKIYRYCYYRLRDAWLAEDVTQETFLRFLGAEGYRDRGRPLAYLYTIARNLCIEESRRRKMEELPEFLPGEDETDTLIDSIALRSALGKLSARERELVVLRVVNEVPMADLAGIYACSRYVLYRELKQIMRKLKRELSEEREDA